MFPCLDEAAAVFAAVISQIVEMLVRTSSLEWNIKLIKKSDVLAVLVA